MLFKGHLFMEYSFFKYKKGEKKTDFFYNFLNFHKNSIKTF